MQTDNVSHCGQGNHTYTLMLSSNRDMHAVHLVAAGHSHYLGLNVYLPPNDQAAFDAPLAAVRHLFPSKDFAQAWAAGERMTMKEAVAMALSEITGDPSTDVIQ